MNYIDVGIVAVIASAATVAVMLWHTQATDFATSAIGGVKAWLQGKKTTLTGLGLKGYIVTQIGSGYFASHDAVYQMGASGLDSDTWLWLAALIAAFLPDFLHAQAQRLASKVSAENKANADMVAGYVEDFASDFRKALNVPPKPVEPTNII